MTSDDDTKTEDFRNIHQMTPRLIKEIPTSILAKKIAKNIHFEVSYDDSSK